MEAYSMCSFDSRDSPKLLHVVVDYLFSLLSSISLAGYTVINSTTPLLMAIWVTSNSRLLGIVLL